MQFDLHDKVACLFGYTNAVTCALRAALAANGARVADDNDPAACDIAVASLPLTPVAEVGVDALQRRAQEAAEAMAARGDGGRIVFLLSSVACMPMKRHPDYSRAMATALAGMRTLAMTSGPSVLVNAVGAGAIGTPLISGDPSMLSHTAVPDPGDVAHVVDTALFFCDPLNTYTSGQFLSVDGGWSAGYARNF